MAKIHIHHRAHDEQKASCFGEIELEKGQGVGVEVGPMMVIAGMIEDGDVIVEIKGPIAPCDSFYAEDKKVEVGH